jgi:energy-coupling factor transporter ATP-binding protein EcfA2
MAEVTLNKVVKYYDDVEAVRGIDFEVAQGEVFGLLGPNGAGKTLSDRGHNLTIADTQAALWYYEKRLYGELGTRERGDIGYEEAIDLIISDGNRPQRPSADLERFRAQGRAAQDVEPQILRSA